MNLVDYRIKKQETMQEHYNESNKINTEKKSNFEVSQQPEIR